MLRCSLCNRGCIGSLPLFKELPPEDIHDIEHLVVHRTYDKGDVVVREGDELVGLYIVEGGQAKVFTHNLSGSEYVLRLLQVGDFYGELSLVSSMPASASVQALTNLKLCCISSHKLRQYLLDHPAAALSILDALAARLRQAEKLSEELGLLDSRQRVAALLLNLATRQGRITDKGIKLQLQLNRDELASMVGLRQETFSRCLTDFRRNNWIVSEGHKVLYILDEASLRGLGRK